GVHLWFDREVTHEPFITLLDTQTQWIFNKTALYGIGTPVSSPIVGARHAAPHSATNSTEPVRSGAARFTSGANTPTAAPAVRKSGQYLQLVISASYDLLKKSREEIVDE